MSIIIPNNGNKGVFITAIVGNDITLSESYFFAKDSLITLEQIIYPSYPNPYATSNIVLFGDNINKVPRDLNKVGPTDRIYSSDVRLFNRVNPIFDASVSTPRFYNTQHTFASPLVGDEVVSIRPFRDLGEWTLQSSRYYPVANEYNVTSGTANAEVGAEKLQLFYKSEDNPFIATLTTNSLIGVNPVLSTSTTNNSDTYTNRNLGVFETEPTTSLLDIFWETSTSGLISDLNLAVDTGEIGPVGFSDITFNLTEGNSVGDIVTNYFQLIKSDGNPTSDASQINMNNLRVIDGNNVDRSKDFNLVSNITSPETLFAIQTNSLFYHGSDFGTAESYTFTIDCVANGITNTLSFNGQLSNITPYVPGTIRYVETNDETFLFDTFNNLFPTLPYVKNLGEVELTSPNSDDEVNIFVFKINNASLDTNRDVEETLVSSRTSMDFVSNIKDRSNGVRMRYDIFTKTYILSVIPRLVKEQIKDYVAGFEPDWTFDFNLYDSIVLGGPGKFVEALVGPGPNNWFPAGAPQPNIIGNNNRNFKFIVKFKYK